MRLEVCWLLCTFPRSLAKFRFGGQAPKARAEPTASLGSGVIEWPCLSRQHAESRAAASAECAEQGHRPFLLGSPPWADSGGTSLSGPAEPRLLRLGRGRRPMVGLAPQGHASVQRGRPDTLHCEIRPCRAGTGGASPGDKPALPSWWFLAINFDQRKHYLSHLSKPTLQLQD